MHEIRLQRACALEQAQRGGCDLETIVLAEQGLEREHFARRDALAERLAQFGADAGVGRTGAEDCGARDERLG